MLSDQLREELKSILADDRMCGYFGDGMELEYIYNGCNMTGLNEMNDQELVDEYADSADEDDEFLAKLRVELESHKLLTSI